MKKISLWVLVFTFAVCVVRGQDTATQQQLDKLTGQIQDLLEAQAKQGKQIDALIKEIGELREKVNTPQVSDSASREDLKKLASQVQEIDQKRQDDRDLILKEIEKLAKAGAIAPPPRKNSTPKTSEDIGTSVTGPQKGYEYVVQAGDSLGLIAKAYRDKGVKVTKAQIIAANPKMNPDVLITGKKIFIPDPAAK
jgi:LysM repeat protein